MGELASERQFGYTDLTAIKPYWGWMVAVSGLLIVLGLAAIYYASATSLITVMLLGLLLITSGVFHLFASIFSRGTKDFFISMLVAILSLIAGMWVIYNPAGAAITLTLAFAIFFILSGAVKVVGALMYRKESKWWSLLLFSGLITFILGILIYSSWPVSGLWVIGLFVGIDVFFAGWRLMSLGFAAKNS